jgi:hypothetical protein
MLASSNGSNQGRFASLPYDIVKMIMQHLINENSAEAYRALSQLAQTSHFMHSLAGSVTTHLDIPTSANDSETGNSHTKINKHFARLKQAFFIQEQPYQEVKTTKGCFAEICEIVNAYRQILQKNDLPSNNMYFVSNSSGVYNPANPTVTAGFALIIIADLFSIIASSPQVNSHHLPTTRGGMINTYPWLKAIETKSQDTIETVSTPSLNRR